MQYIKGKDYPKMNDEMKAYSFYTLLEEKEDTLIMRSSFHKHSSSVEVPKARVYPTARIACYRIEIRDYQEGGYIGKPNIKMWTKYFPELFL